MVNVHRINNEVLMINCDLIEYIEETPNTVVSMISGRKIVVIETCEEIRNKVIDYKRRIFGIELSKGK